MRGFRRRHGHAAGSQESDSDENPSCGSLVRVIHAHRRRFRASRRFLHHSSQSLIGLGRSPGSRGRNQSRMLLLLLAHDAMITLRGYEAAHTDCSRPTRGGAKSLSLSGTTSCTSVKKSVYLRFAHRPHIPRLFMVTAWAPARSILPDHLKFDGARPVSYTHLTLPTKA